MRKNMKRYTDVHYVLYPTVCNRCEVNCGKTVSTQTPDLAESCNKNITVRKIENAAQTCIMCFTPLCGL